jgi:hypothetical protein|tara:strand:+ start:1081 stop:5718 length:4638 start_codon:yes stop_codon:yes gene_type:complete
MAELNKFEQYEASKKSSNTDLRSKVDPRPIREQTTIDPKSGEEVPAATSIRSMKSLNTNPEWLSSARSIFKHEKGEDHKGTDKHLSNWLKNRQAKLSWDIYNLGSTALDVKNFSPEVEEAWVTSLNLYDEADPDLKSAWNALRQAATDPMAAAIGIPSLGSGYLLTKLGGRAAAMAARGSFKKQLIKNLVDRGVTTKVATQFAERGVVHRTITAPILSKARSKASKTVARQRGKTALLPGATYMGAYDLAQQTFDINMEFIDPKTGEIKEYDPIQTLTAALEGALSTAVLSKYGGRASEKLFRKRRVRQNSEKLTALERATVTPVSRTTSTIRSEMDISNIQQLAFDTQRKLIKGGRITLNMKGVRALTEKQKNKRGASKDIQSRASIEEIKNTFKSLGIELAPVRGSKNTKFIGRKFNEFNIGPQSAQKYGSELGRGELTVGWLKKKVSSDAGLPKEAGVLIRHREAGEARAKRVAEQRVKQLDRAVRKEFFGTSLKQKLIDRKTAANLPENTLADLNNILRGNALTVSKLSNKYKDKPQTLKVVKDMRKDLQYYQKTLLETGAIKKDIYKKGKKIQNPLYAKIEKSMDGKTTELWINRQYKIFNDPAWKEVAYSTPDIYVGARTFLKNRVFQNNKKLADIDNKMNDHITVDKSGISNYNYQSAAQAGITPNDIALHQSYFDPDVGYVTKLMDDIMNIHGEDEMFKLFGSANDGLKIGKNPIKILDKRKNIPLPIRKLMGEYNDPFTNYENSFLKLNSTINTYRYEKGMSELVKGGYIPGAGPLRSRARAETTELKSRFPERTGIDVPYEEGFGAATEGLQRPLSGLYGRSSVADAILNGNEILHQTAAAGKARGNYIGGKVIRGYLYQQGLTRGSKVLYSLTAYPRNFLSAGMMAFGAGYFRPKYLKALKPVFKEMAGWSDPAIRGEIEKLIALGVHQSGVHLGSIRANFADAASGSLFAQVSPLQRSQKGIATRAKKFNLKVAEVYQSLDDMWKYFGFLNEKQNYRNVLIGRASLAKIKQQAGEALNREERKLLDEWNRQGDKFYNPSLHVVEKNRSSDGVEYALTYLDRVAADQTLRHMQNYASVSQFIKYLRTIPFADFFSYTSELARTQYHILKTAKDEVREGMELMKRDIRLPDGTLAGEDIASNGLYRLGSTMIAQSSAGAASAWSADKVISGATNLSSDAFDYIQSFDKDYAKGNYYYWLTPPKDGKGKRINLSYVFPWANYQTPINATIQGIQTGGDDVDYKIGQAVWDNTVGTLVDWFGPSMYAEALGRVWMGYDEYGRKIYKEGVENLGYNTVQFMKEMWRAYSPGGQGAVENIVRSYTDRPDLTKFEAYELEKQGIDPDSAIRRGKSGSRFNSQDQWIALSGIKPEEYDIKIQMGYDIANIKSEMADAGKIFTRMVQEKSPTTVDDLVEAYDEALKIQFSKAKDLNDIFERARGAGLDNAAIIKSISSQGLYDIDKQMWNSLLETGRYIPPKPRSSQIKKWWKESLLEVDSAPPIWEAQSQLMKIYNQYRNSSLISEEPNKFEIYEQSKQRN